MGPFDAHFVIGVAVAAAVALFAHGGLAALARRWAWVEGLSGAATLLAGAAGLAAMYAPAGFPPRNVIEWPIWVTLLGAAMMAVAPTRRWRRVLVAMLLAGGCALEVLHPLREFADQARTLAIGIGLAAGVAALATETAFGTLGPLTTRLAIAIAAVSAFGALMLAGSFQVGFRAGVIPAAIVAPCALMWWRSMPVQGLPTAYILLVASLGVLAYGLTDWTTPPKAFALAPCFALLAFAPAAAWIAAIPALRSRPRLAAAAAIIAVALIAGAGLGWLALHQPVRTPDDSGWG